MESHADSPPPPDLLLLLRGTIPMQYRNVTYHLPIELILPRDYPHVGPKVYVRPEASSMSIKPNHKHVGSDGMVYLPYLAEWNNNTAATSSSSSSSRGGSNLKDLVIGMSRLFGEEPPCFARPGGGDGGGLRQQWRSGGTATPQELALEREIDEANRAAETARRAEAIERRREAERDRLREEQLLLREARLSSLKCQATEEIRARMKSIVYAELGEEIRMELRYQKKLEYGQERIDLSWDEYETKRGKLKEKKRELDAAVDALGGWLAAVDTFNNSATTPPMMMPMSTTTTRADLMALPTDTPSAQMLSLSAESASIDDTIYFLDQALVRNAITLDIFMKEVRRLSKRQFLAKVRCVYVVE